MPWVFHGISSSCFLRDEVSMRSLALLLVLLLVLLPAPALAQLRVLETRDLRLVYDEVNLGFLAPHAARCFENSMRSQRRLFDYEPSERVTVILNDFGDYGNAAAGATPRLSLMVGVAPTSLIYETYPANERINTLMNHELVHIAALDRAAGSDRVFRSLFLGKVKETAEDPETILYNYLTTPRSSCPRWFHEGIAVFVETWMAGGCGRALGAYDEMVFRSMVRDGSRFYDPLGLESEGTKIDFQAGVNSYLYGTRFMSYLAYVHSPESLLRWVSRAAGSRKYYSAQFSSVYGKPLDEAWADWIAFEHRFQEANLDSIRQYPATPYRDIAREALGSVSRAYYEPRGRRLYAALNYPGQVAHIAAISLDGGSIEKICDVKGPAIYYVTSLAYDPAGQRLFYTADNDYWRDLCAVDPATGKSRTLIRDARVGDLAFSRADSLLWGVRHMNGIATLVRIPPPYTRWEQVYSWPYGRFIYDIDISPDGKWLAASLGEVSGRQTVRLMALEALARGDTTSTTLMDFGAAIPGNFVFSPDGRALYGSSYYTGVSNIFRYDLERRTQEVVSNCETGFFRPVPLPAGAPAGSPADSLIVFRYTGQGFVPALIEARPLADVSAIRFLGQQVVDKHPVVKDWIAGSPAAVDLDSLTTGSGRYRGLAGVRLESAYPVAEGYKDFAAFGWRFNFSDPALLNSASLTATYTPNTRLDEDERLHLHLRYRRHQWALNSWYNDADFYDLFGPTKSGRKGYALGLRYARTLIFDRPRTLDFTAGATGYGGLERLPEAQNITTSFDRLVAADVRLKFKHLRASLGAVDPEKGLQWEIAATSNYVNRKAFPLARAGLDLGLALPLRHSSVWLRSAAGWSPGDREEPFANFYFGGFGNNWVDNQEAKRYREYYAFPGVELNEVAGTDFGKLLVEWNLPPLRFRRFGTPAFYASWARAALFSSGLVTNIGDDPARHTLGNAGAQLDLRLRVLSHLDMTVSAGYAVAAERRARRSDELMFSVKVL